MLQFEGDRDFDLSPGRVFVLLGNPAFLVKCVPGVEGESRFDAESAQCTLRPGFSFVRGTLELTLRIVERTPESALHIGRQSRGIGSSSEIEARLTLAAAANGTRLHWLIEIKSLGGLLKAVPQGLIKASAQKVIGEALSAVERELTRAGK